MFNRNSGVVGGLLAAAAVACSAGVALAQPANDACANAIPLSLSANSSVVVSGTTTGANADGGTGNCGTSNNSPDVWYTVVAPASGQLIASTCGAATNYDAVVAFKTSATCPGANISGACDDDGCGTVAGPGVATLSAAVSGTTYRIRVTGFQGRSGNFTLTVSHMPPPGPPDPALGPDVIVNVLTDVRRWGTNAAGTITAYSVGTDSCNRGDYPVMWVDNSNFTPDYNNTQHPVIGQNLYRLRSYGGYSRFEHLGQSWLKHGFVSTNSGGCGGCAPNSTSTWRPSLQGYQSFGGDVLGINCSDTYGASLNGDQTTHGAKSIVHPTLGTSPFVRNNGTGESTIRQRLQVPTSDVTGQPAGTRFFVDGQYVTADDAQFVRPGEAVAFNSLNNASWREVNAGAMGNQSPGFVGGTVQMQPGIFAWRNADPLVTLVSADHDDMPNPCTGFRAPDGGPQYPEGKFARSRFWIGAKVTDLGGGQYRYEYAVYNQTSDRGAASFSVPFPDAAEAPSSFTFHAPQYHSGEPYSNAPWTMVKDGNMLTFSTQSFGENANAGAIRWGTLYNFGFTTDIAPTGGTATIGLFKPGATVDDPTSVAAANVPVPTLPPSCPSDFNGDGLRNPDDLADFITCFFLQVQFPGVCLDADFNDDGFINPDDLADFITTFFIVPC